jgi:hypothetical protein
MSSLLSRPRTAALALPVLLASVLLVAGCAGRADVAASRAPLPTPVNSSTAESPTPTPAVSATAVPTASPAPTESVPEAVPSEPAPTTAVPVEPVPAAVERCHGSDLALEYVPDPEASGAGSSAFDLVFTNVSAAPCALAGIPGVYPTDADGVRIGAVASSFGPNPAEPFAVQPGGRADVRVLWHSPGAYGCPSARSSRIVAEVVDDVDPAVAAPAEIEVCTDGTVMLEASTYTLLG